MANHKQAAKRNRQRLKRRVQNIRYLASMRTYIKRVRKALADGDLDTAKTGLDVAVRAIGRAASRGVIHRNTAARYVSRLTKSVNRAS